VQKVAKKGRNESGKIEKGREFFGSKK